MAIKARIQDAQSLWDAGRFEGAFLCALVAVAATSRRRYPDRNVVRDREAFEQFLTKTMSVWLSVEFRGDCHSIEHIFYRWLRCELVHEGGVPVDILFTDGDSLTVRAGGAPNYTLLLSRGWFRHLVDSVVLSPENAEEFGID